MRQLIVAIALCIFGSLPNSASAEPWGRSQTTAVLTGTAQARNHRISVSVGTDVVRVREVIELMSRHQPIVFVLPDWQPVGVVADREAAAEDGLAPEASMEERNAYVDKRLREMEPIYASSEWAIDHVRVRVDGREIEPEFRIWSFGRNRGESEWDGGWVFTVPSHAQRAEVTWSFLPDAEMGEAMARLELPRETWSRASADPIVDFTGVSAPTAMHLLVETDGTWRQSGDEIVFRARNGQLTLAGVTWPTVSCATSIERHGPPGLMACIGYLTDSGLWSQWVPGARAGCYSQRRLRLARNWIFARHGRPFKSDDLRRFFASQKWYEADPAYEDARLTPGERKAIATIQHLERRCARSKGGSD